MKKNRTIKILIVDDESTIRRNIISKIKRMSLPLQYIIYESPGASDAEYRYEEIRPDLVITDICMPKRNGIQLVKYIRDRDKDCWIFVISGHDDYEYVREGFLLGINDYLLKPLSFSELNEKMRRFCADQNVICPQEEHEYLKSEKPLITGKMKRAEEFIEKNYMRNPSMQECADYCGMSYAYFSKLFKETFHTVYSQYVSEKRMMAAKELLDDPTYKIGEIGKKVGFDNPNHFSRAFYRTFGMYPTEYRRKQEGGEDGVDKKI